MTTTNATLSLHALMARLESSEHLSVTDHEFAEHPETPWVSLDAGDFSMVVTLFVDAARVTVATSDNRTLYAQTASGEWITLLTSFLESLALAAVPA